MTLSRRTINWGLASFLAAAVAVPASSLATESPVSVRIDPAYAVTPLLTGLYVAQERGFFREQGLEVEFVPPGGNATPTLVGSGNVDFAVSPTQDIVQARQRGIPVVSVAGFLAHNTSAFVSLKDKGISRPKDFENKTYGGWGGPIEGAILRAVVAADGGDPDLVKYVNIGASSPITTIRAGDADFVWTWVGWDVVRATQEGLEISHQFLRDYEPALDWYTPTLITSEATIADHPETVQKVVNAVAQGFEYAIENPGEAAAILHRSAPDSDAELLKASQAWYSNEYQDDGVRWGYQRPEQWELSVKWLTEAGILEPGFDASGAFTNRFIEARPGS